MTWQVTTYSLPGCRVRILGIHSEKKKRVWVWSESTRQGEDGHDGGECDVEEVKRTSASLETPTVSIIIMPKIPRLDPAHTAFLLCDVQARFSEHPPHPADACPHLLEVLLYTASMRSS